MRSGLADPYRSTGAVGEPTEAAQMFLDELFNDSEPEIESLDAAQPIQACVAHSLLPTITSP